MKSLHDINEEGKALYGETPSSFTDKECESGHTYIDAVYEELLAPFREDVKMLEIGVSSGGSLWLWKNYFQKYDILALDILPEWCVKRPFQFDLQNDPNIHIQWNRDSNNPNTWIDMPNEHYDIIIDDGDHWIDSQIINFNNAWSKLRVGGVFVIEDVINESVLPRLEAAISENANAQIRVYKGRIDTRPDDIIVVVTKV